MDDPLQEFKRRVTDPQPERPQRNPAGPEESDLDLAECDRGVLAFHRAQSAEQLHL